MPRKVVGELRLNPHNISSFQTPIFPNLVYADGNCGGGSSFSRILTRRLIFLPGHVVAKAMS